ncbi:MAG: heparinase II/III family protein [Rhizomicrobium sp.]
MPAGAFAENAHAACLAFEFSSGSQRIIVNCGAAGSAQPKWESALRATAAHSTLVLADARWRRSCRRALPRNLLGARMLRGPKEIETRRVETTQGWCVEASHDAYMVPYGVRHERQITLSQQGLAITGADRLLPVPSTKAKKDIPFAIRFHIHPDVRVLPESRAAGCC